MANCEVNPYFREFVYDVLFNLQPEDKFLLKGQFYRLCRTNSRAKRFCDTASSNQLYKLLNMLGFKWFLVLVDNKDTPRHLQQVFEKYKDRRGAELKIAVEKGFYITRDKKFVEYLTTVAETIHSSEYVQNLELRRAGYHHRKWSKRLNTPNVNQAYENIETLRSLTEFIVNSHIAMKSMNIPENDLVIMLFLMMRKSYTPFLKIREIFDSVLSEYKVKKSIRRLEAAQRIDQNPSSDKKEYMITSLGMEDLKRLLDSSLK